MRILTNPPSLCKQHKLDDFSKFPIVLDASISFQITKTQPKYTIWCLGTLKMFLKLTQPPPTIFQTDRPLENPDLQKLQNCHDDKLAI